MGHQLHRVVIATRSNSVGDRPPNYQITVTLLSISWLEIKMWMMQTVPGFALVAGYFRTKIFCKTERHCSRTLDNSGWKFSGRYHRTSSFWLILHDWQAEKAKPASKDFFRAVFFLPVAFTVYFYLGTIAVSSRFDKSTTEERPFVDQADLESHDAKSESERLQKQKTNMSK